MGPFSSPLDQAWLRLWVGLFGPTSQLCKYIESNGEADEHRWSGGFHARPWSGPVDGSGKQQGRDPGPPRMEGDTAVRPPPPRQARPPSSRPPRPPKVARRSAIPRMSRPPAERAERRIDREVGKLTRLPTADWAKAIVEDQRLHGITLEHILDGIDDYFEIFDQLRKVSPAAHAYFSRVGAPIVMSDSRIWRSQAWAARALVSGAELPSFFGAFFSRGNKDKFREDALADDVGFASEFHLFEKPRNHATVAAPGTTVFSHSTIHLKRDCFSKAERKQHPWLANNWSMWWYVGIAPDGEIRALPHRFQRYQRLPGGDGVHHSTFEIPPGLYEISDTLKDPHLFTRVNFNVVVAFAAAATAGIQVTIKKGKRAARFGVPVTALKSFFADRDPDGDRRKQILHLRLAHDRTTRDGRSILVGEHLRGERFFTWRGYEVAVGIAGIHFPAPEGWREPLWVMDDPEAPLPDDFDTTDIIPVGDAAKKFRKRIWRPARIPFRRGQPTSTTHASTLPQLDDHDMRNADPFLIELFEKDDKEHPSC